APPRPRPITTTISSCACCEGGGVARVEQTLLEGGRTGAVIQQRTEFQEVMRGRFTRSSSRRPDDGGSTS
ncbi:MAG: hypothetical protein WKF96_10405, partial [Solirubrobacteraceae bacterium]